MTSTRHHVLDVYGVHLYLATSKREWSTLRRKLDFLDKTPDNYAGLTTFATWHPKEDGPTIPYLVFWVDARKHPDHAELVETCAHEAAHGAGRILEWVEHPVAGTDEPSAYLIGWLTRWLFEACVA